MGVPDSSLTAMSGVVAVAEMLEVLDVVGRFDRGVGPIKQRARGASAGELLVCLAQSQLMGAEGLVGLDRQRLDVAGVELSGVPVLASTTAAGLARRFGPEQLAGVESGVADLIGRGFELLPLERRGVLEGKVTVGGAECLEFGVDGVDRDVVVVEVSPHLGCGPVPDRPVGGGAVLAGADPAMPASMLRGGAE